MNSGYVTDKIKEFLDGACGREDRISRIKDMQHLLNFELQVAELTDEEQRDMCTELKGNSSKIDSLQSATARDRYFMDLARHEYMRQCSWSDYLNGVTDEKPTRAGGL